MRIIACAGDFYIEIRCQLTPSGSETHVAYNRKRGKCYKVTAAVLMVLCYSQKTPHVQKSAAKVLVTVITVAHVDSVSPYIDLSPSIHRSCPAVNRSKRRSRHKDNQTPYSISTTSSGK
jgi:hypothetical protein